MCYWDIYKNDEATRQVLDADGWFHTGDLGTMDSDNNVYIKGRSKNMLLGSNGQNIYPEEIEDKLSISRHLLANVLWCNVAINSLGWFILTLKKRKNLG